MAGVFVSYRRDDSQGFAGRLADDLDEILGPDRVFRDIEIPIGSDFTDVLHRAIATSDILLVVIGRHWAANSDQGYGSRLFEPTDWVRAEIESAFALGKQVVPVLVGGARIPASDALPNSIERLSRLQAANLSDRRWDAEIAELADRLRSICPTLAQDRPRQKAVDSPAEVLHELGERFLNEVVAEQRPSAKPPTVVQRILLRLGSDVRKLLSFVVVLGLIYVGMRLFGDESLLRDLDALEARLHIGWQRLMQYIGRL